MFLVHRLQVQLTREVQAQSVFRLAGWMEMSSVVSIFYVNLGPIFGVMNLSFKGQGCQGARPTMRKESCKG